MGKFDGYLLLSDFDGTLAHVEHEIIDGKRRAIKVISRENCDAIRYFQSEGGLFTLATGRSFDWLKQWSTHFVPNTYVVSYNGAHICSPDGKEVLFSRPLDGDYVELAERIRIACPDLEWVHFHSLDETPRFLKGETIDREQFHAPIFKMVFYAHRIQSEEYAKTVANLIDDRYVSMRSWVNGIEILMRGATKGEAIKHLKVALGDRARTVVAVGDYENDISMFKCADVSYAPENAIPAIKELATHITANVRDAAVAHVIEDIEKRYL